MPAVKQPIRSAPGPSDTNRRPRRRAAQRCLEKIEAEVDRVVAMSEQERVDNGFVTDSEDEEFNEGDKLYSDEESHSSSSSSSMDTDDDDFVDE